MKILFVNHTFPPESYAGSELCVYNLAKEFQRRGHKAAVFYRYADSSDDEYTIRSGDFRDVPTYKINNTYRFAHSFQNIYVNPAIAAKFGCLLREIRPDVVHFHHLTNLSLSLVHETGMYGCPAVMTLHDYWLLCQRGQLLKRNLDLCDGPSMEKCRSCLSLQLLRGNVQRLVSGILKVNSKFTGSSLLACDLLDLSKAEIKTGQRDFVAVTTFGIGDSVNETLLAHPSSEIIYSIELESPAVLKAAVAMHPSTYTRDGGGVLFEIERNGEILFSQKLDPKRCDEHKGWHEVELELGSSEQEKVRRGGMHGRHEDMQARMPALHEDRLILRTLPDGGDNIFCAAAWRNPKIFYKKPSGIRKKKHSERNKEIKGYFYQASEIVADAVTALSPQSAEGIYHRKNWVNRLWNEIDLFISPSNFLRNFFIRHGMPEQKIIFSDNGFLPPPRFKPRKPVHPIRFGYLGTWIPSKGIDIALKAFKDIDPNKAKLIVYGFFPGYDGYEDYEAYIHALSGPAVDFQGKYDPELVYDVLAEIDCLVMPSIWWENSPLTIHEAFQALVPVITADVGGMAEWVREGGGMTFRHRDPQSLRSVIRRIINDPEVLEDLRMTIPDVKSVTQHADELLEIYSNLIETKQVLL